MNPGKFYEDAEECVRLANQATADEDKAVLIDLARAWLLLGEQVEHVDQGYIGELPKASNLAPIDRQ
jgi:hypothetical protein